jgi:hypothetical protein
VESWSVSSVWPDAGSRAISVTHDELRRWRRDGACGLQQDFT